MPAHDAGISTVLRIQRKPLNPSSPCTNPGAAISRQAASSNDVSTQPVLPFSKAGSTRAISPRHASMSSTKIRLRASVDSGSVFTFSTRLRK